MHALIFGGLLSRPIRSLVPVERPRTEFVPLELPPLPELPPPEPEQEPPPPPPEESPPPPARKPALRELPRENAPSQPEPEPAVASEPSSSVDVGLAGEGLEFSTGGSVKPDPVRSAVRPVAPKPAPPRPPKEPAVVRVSDLSERPKPPVLDARLAKHYPSDLRRRGIEGEALVRLVLSESGRAVQVNPVSFSHEEFARACQKTLEGTEWSPPKDRNGKPVRTTLSYRCRFRVAL